MGQTTWTESTVRCPSSWRDPLRRSNDTPVMSGDPKGTSYGVFRGSKIFADIRYGPVQGPEIHSNIRSITSMELQISCKLSWYGWQQARLRNLALYLPWPWLNMAGWPSSFYTLSRLAMDRISGIFYILFSQPAIKFAKNPANRISMKCYIWYPA